MILLFSVNMLYQYNKRVNNLLTPFKNRILANLKNHVLVFEVFAYVNKIDEIRPSFIFFTYKLQINDIWIFHTNSWHFPLSSPFYYTLPSWFWFLWWFTENIASSYTLGIIGKIILYNLICHCNSVIHMCDVHVSFTT